MGVGVDVDVDDDDAVELDPPPPPQAVSRTRAPRTRSLLSMAASYRTLAAEKPAGVTPGRIATPQKAPEWPPLWTTKSVRFTERDRLVRGPLRTLSV